MRLLLPAIPLLLLIAACGGDAPEFQDQTSSAAASPTALGATNHPQATAASPTSVRCTPTQYAVQAGDTLGSIAVAHDTTLQTLVDANADIDPDALSIGQVVIVPCARASETATESP